MKMNFIFCFHFLHTFHQAFNSLVLCSLYLLKIILLSVSEIIFIIRYKFQPDACDIFI